MPLVEVDQQEKIVTLKLNRERALHALNSEMIEALLSILQQTENQAEVILLTGKGERAFCAGADIEEMSQLDEQDLIKFTKRGHALMNQIANCTVPILAVVNGYALGGGLELALACDFILASESAKLGLPEATLGLIPGFGGMQRLSEILGRRKAKELIFSGKALKAKEAKSIGLVSQVFSSDQLDIEANSLAKKIASYPHHAVCSAKKEIDQSYEPCLKTSLEREQKSFVSCFQSKTTKELLKTFINKRKQHAKRS